MMDIKLSLVNMYELWILIHAISFTWWEQVGQVKGSCHLDQVCLLTAKRYTKYNARQTRDQSYIFQGIYIESYTNMK